MHGQARRVVPTAIPGLHAGSFRLRMFQARRPTQHRILLHSTEEAPPSHSLHHYEDHRQQHQRKHIREQIWNYARRARYQVYSA